MLPYWLGEMPIVLLALAYKFLAHYRQHGNWWSRHTSKYYNQKGVDKFNLIGLFVRVFLLTASQLMFYMVLAATEAAHANLAVVSSMFALAAFFTAGVF